MTNTIPAATRLLLGRAPSRRLAVETTVTDQTGRGSTVWIPEETPLTITIDGTEIVTLMTLGSHPEELALGYVRNQQLIGSLEDIASVAIDWDSERAAIGTVHGGGVADLRKHMARLTVGSGCGQGTLFSCTLDKLLDRALPPVALTPAVVREVLRQAQLNSLVYHQAGSVHGCGLFRQAELMLYVEDVGRHNAADAIAGRMWLEGWDGRGDILFTTGRLTTEIVMKAAFMGIPALISRSGVTRMGLGLAEDLGMTVIGRASGSRFLVYAGAENVAFGEPPGD
jgi:FdhD protein